MKKLPHCDRVFELFFDRWYDDDDRRRKLFEATRPDLLEDPGLAGRDPRKISPLTDECQDEVLGQVDRMVDAARGDWPLYLDVREPMDIEWIRAFDAHYDRKKVLDLLTRSDPADLSNDLLVVSFEFGAMIGFVMRQRSPTLRWLAEWPYWESSIFDGRTGHIILVFHGAIKKMSSYGIDDGFADKTEACLQLLDDEAGGKKRR